MNQYLKRINVPISWKIAKYFHGKCDAFGWMVVKVHLVTPDIKSVKLFEINGYRLHCIVSDGSDGSQLINLFDTDVNYFISIILMGVALAEFGS